MGAIVRHIDGERFEWQLLIPRQKVTAHNLVGETSLALKANVDFVGACFDGPESELLQQIIVLRCEFEARRGLAVEQHSQRAAYISSTFLCSHKQCSERHDRGLR